MCALGVLQRRSQKRQPPSHEHGDARLQGSISNSSVLKPLAVDWAVACFDRLRLLELAANDDQPLTVPLTEAAVRCLERFGSCCRRGKKRRPG
jgi:hypothetical protein